MSNRKKLAKLEDSKLWQSAHAVARYVYDLHSQLPADEKAETLYKFRGRAVELTGYVAEIEGAISLRDTEYDSGQARRALFGVRNSYRYLVDREVIKLDPDFMLKLDTLLVDIDTLLQETWKKLDAAEQETKK